MEMEAIVSYCGIICQGCPIYWATREKNIEKKEKMRVTIARLGSEHYGTEFKPEDITDCDGCRKEGGRLLRVSSDCPIRKCARQKGLENCAHCPEYVCENLKKFFSKDTQAKAILEVIKNTL
jgi:hypothetical protein